MGWQSNSIITNQILPQILGAQENPNSYGMPWDLMFTGNNDLGTLNAEKQKTATTMRDVNTGTGSDPRELAAGGGDQWALGNAGRMRNLTAAAGRGGTEAAATTAAAAKEGANFDLTRAGQIDRFNLDKYRNASQVLAGGSKYVTSPWLGMLTGLVSGAASAGVGALGHLGSGDDAPVTQDDSPNTSDSTTVPGLPGFGTPEWQPATGLG